MSLGQYLEYIARFVLIMPCVMRKRSQGSIGLTNSSPWRQNRNVVCHLGSPFCQTPQLMLGPEHLVRNVLIEKHTLTPKVLCLSLVRNHCKIKGVNFQKNIEWPCQNIEKSRCQENLHVHINTVSLSLCFIFNV